LAHRFSETIVTTHCYQSTLRNVAEYLNLKQAYKCVLSGMHDNKNYLLVLNFPVSCTLEYW